MHTYLANINNQIKLKILTALNVYYTIITATKTNKFHSNFVWSFHNVSKQSKWYDLSTFFWQRFTCRKGLQLYFIKNVNAMHKKSYIIMLWDSFTHTYTQEILKSVTHRIGNKKMTKTSNVSNICSFSPYCHHCYRYDATSLKENACILVWLLCCVVSLETFYAVSSDSFSCLHLCQC